MWHYHDGMGWWMVFIGVTMAILYVGIFGMLIRNARQTSNDDEIQNKHALNIARERYARGEISKKEFEQIKHDIA